MRRYFTPKVDGELKCSPEALKMWKDKKGRALVALKKKDLHMYKLSMKCWVCFSGLRSGVEENVSSTWIFPDDGDPHQEAPC